MGAIDKKTIKILLSKTDNVNNDTNLLNDVSDEFITGYLTWGFLNKKFDMMNYFFKEFFRLGLICGFRAGELERDTNSKFKLETLEERLELPGLYEIDSYREELEKNGVDIHKFFSPIILSLIGNIIASSYIPFIVSGSEYNKYDENIIPYNMERLSKLSDDKRDELNMTIIHRIIMDMRNILDRINLYTSKTKYFRNKHKYDSKIKFKFDQLETFRTLNADFVIIMYNINQTFMVFLKSLTEESPANNTILSNSIYLEKMVTFLSNMISNMNNFIINLDKEILKNERRA